MTRSQGPLSELGPAVRASLRSGITGIAPLVVTADAWANELGVLIGEGLAPLVLKLLGNETTEPSVREQLVKATTVQQLRSLAAEAILDLVSDLLGQASVQFVVVKGPAVARLHPQGWPRPYNDIDLLVEPSQFGPALALLLQHGFIYPPASLPPWSWFDQYCREGLNLTGAGEVDLHHHLAPWAFGAGLRSIDVINGASEVALRGRTVLLASPEHSAVIAAVHVLNDLWKGQRGLVSWRDLVVIIRQSEPEQVRAAFVQSGLGWLFNVVVSAVQLHLPGLLDDVDCGPARIPNRFSWRMRGLGWDHSNSVSRHRLAWAIRLPLPQAAAFVLGTALPSRRYICARHGSYRDYWHQAWAETMSTFTGADHRMDKKRGDDQVSAA